MLEPIILTKYGEALKPYSEETAKRDAEKQKLLSCVGLHAVCDGWVDIKEVSPTHSALVCRHCRMRVVIPKEVDTWAKLQERMKHIPQVKDVSPLREKEDDPSAPTPPSTRVIQEGKIPPRG